MPIQITMPALSPTMEEGNLAKWLVKEGDSVSSGDVIAEIETDKATMEVEAVDEGTVAKIVVPEGTEGVKVNALIAVLAQEGEDVADAAKAAGNGGAGAAAPSSPSPQPAEAAQESGGERPPVGEEGARPAPSPAAQPPRLEVVEGGKDGRVFSSPLARRIAREAGIDLAAVAGSGPRGRVVKANVEAALSGGAVKAPEAPAPAPKPMSDDQVLKLFEEGSYELVP
ncbi:biotin/lipoyl-containing protein, partial [Chelativorans alearense]|uniref:biotin/lipoyl-containing protein n=1 Tax=Chelativorans alearense TaxID=2681495 RepID=UPI0013D70234